MTNPPIAPPREPLRRTSGLRAGSILLVLTGTLLAACTASRDLGSGRPITDYAYAVIGDDATDGYMAEAQSVLAQSFIVLPENDPRLDQSNVWKNACVVSVNSARGFWSTSAAVEMKDFRTRNTIISSQVRRGGLWAGAQGDVVDALKDIAAAKGPRRPEPVELSASAPASDQSAGQGRTKAQRLTELADLRARGLITEAEYTNKRQLIIDER